VYHQLALFLYIAYYIWLYPHESLLLWQSL
jgi:hypothetical protein